MLQLNNLLEKLITLLPIRGGTVSRNRPAYTDDDLPVWADDIEWISAEDIVMQPTYNRPIYTEADIATI